MLADLLEAIGKDLLELAKNYQLLALLESRMEVAERLVATSIASGLYATTPRSPSRKRLLGLATLVSGPRGRKAQRRKRG